MAAHLERVRGRIDEVLELSDDELIQAVGGGKRDALAHEHDRLDTEAVRARSRAAGIEQLCRCQAAYPLQLRALRAPPAVLHVAGGIDRLLELVAQDPVAIVGARAASPYGSGMARSLAAGLARAGLTVVSGMANGIDSAAHTGALQAGAATLAVLPGSANQPYPAGRRSLYRRLVSSGAAVSELPPGCAVWRWMFPARNRIIAALATMTIVVEAGERSGALVTAQLAKALGRPLGAVPGQVTTRQAAGPNQLIAAGATVVRGAQDVLDALFGEGVRTAVAAERPALAEELAALLQAIATGHDTAAALVRAGVGLEQGLVALASLELAGYIRREPGGRYSVVP
jgi:DNA processing protein